MKSLAVHRVHTEHQLSVENVILWSKLSSYSYTIIKIDSRVEVYGPIPTRLKQEQELRREKTRETGPPKFYRDFTNSSVNSFLKSIKS